MEITLSVTLLTALFALLLTGGVFLVAILAFLLRGVNAMLSPLKDNQVRLESRMDRIESDINRIESDIKEIKSLILSSRQTEKK